MAQPDQREALRDAIAAEHQLFLELDRHRLLTERWRARAELAIRCGDDALARQALERETAEARLAAEYRAQYLSQSEVVRRAKRRHRSMSMPVAPIAPTVEDRLDHLAREVRLEQDLAVLKAQLAAGSSLSSLGARES